MKKLIALLVLIVCVSCHTTKYTHSGNVTSMLDLQKGKWLLNTIDSSKDIQENLEKIATEEFRELLGDRFSVVSTTRRILIPRNIDNNPSKSILKDVKNGTGADFFIMISAKVIRDEIGDLQIGSVDNPVQNIGEITVDIYDLNLLERFYTHTAVGNLYVGKNSQDFAFAKSANNIVRKGLKRILKKIKKNQI